MQSFRYRKTQCPGCGAWVTTNALGRASHDRSAKHAAELKRRAQAERSLSRLANDYTLWVERNLANGYRVKREDD
jgi:hypothetical protein